MAKYYDLRSEAKFNAILLVLLAIFVLVMFAVIFGFEHLEVGLTIALIVVIPILWTAHSAYRYSQNPTKS